MSGIVRRQCIRAWNEAIEAAAHRAETEPQPEGPPPPVWTSPGIPSEMLARAAIEATKQSIADGIRGLRKQGDLDEA